MLRHFKCIVIISVLLKYNEFHFTFRGMVWTKSIVATKSRHNNIEVAISPNILLFRRYGEIGLAYFSSAGSVMELLHKHF